MHHKTQQGVVQLGPTQKAVQLRTSKKVQHCRSFLLDFVILGFSVKTNFYDQVYNYYDVTDAQTLVLTCIMSYFYLNIERYGTSISHFVGQLVSASSVLGKKHILRGFKMTLQYIFIL